MELTVIFDEYEGNLPHIEAALRTLCDTFEQIYSHAGYHYGHAVIQDYNWDSVDWAIEHIDDFHADVIERYGAEQAQVWRDATLHLLHIIKIVVDKPEAIE